MRLAMLVLFILVCLIPSLIGCGGGSTTEGSTPAIEPPPATQVLPAISELNSYYSEKAVAAFGDEQTYPFQVELGNYSANAIVNAGSVQLPSGASEMSAAWYGFTLSYVLDASDPENIVYAPVPYIAPYELRVTTQGGSYWFLTADFRNGKWNIHAEEYNAGTQTFPIGLAANASNMSGTFWFAIVTYGGENATITGLELDYPSQLFEAIPITYHEYITADDGTQLATDVYLPMDTGSILLPPPPYPVILFRTPYYKDPLLYGAFSQAIGGVNAVMIVQYFRGRLSDSGVWPDSTGTETLFREHAGPDHTDSLDTLAWIKERQFYNGDMLLAGPSALGVSAYQTAATAGADIKGFYPIMSTSDIGTWAAQRNGCFKRSNVEGWLTEGGFPSELLTEAETAYATDDADYWAAVDFTTQASGVNAPGWHETGWYDVDVESTIASWDAISTNGGPLAADNQWLVIGPWTHDNAGSRGNVVGDLSFPNDDSIHDPSVLPAGWDALALNQWGFYVIGRTLGYTPPTSRVLVYLIGEEGTANNEQNIWLELPGWPPAGDGMEAIYLDATGMLIPDVPGVEDTITVPYDSSDPVLTLGGANLPVIFDSAPVAAGPFDQRAVSVHPDVRMFATPWTIGGVYTIAGPIELTLWVSTDMADCEVMAKLVDVYPDGTEIPVADSAVRLSRYLGEDVVVDEIYEVHLTIGERAYSFGDEHVQRLDIAASNYPRFDLVPVDTTGTITLYVGPTHPSKIELPTFDPLAL